jgi:hypothetical protein
MTCLNAKSRRILEGLRGTAKRGVISFAVDVRTACLKVGSAVLTCGTRLCRITSNASQRPYRLV